jgi:hypothetical protein
MPGIILWYSGNIRELKKLRARKGEARCNEPASRNAIELDSASLNPDSEEGTTKSTKQHDMRSSGEI